tara:strand:- start:29 stop:154 length:126 start_codon:yes stop_codon:yes gene_type:complete
VAVGIEAGEVVGDRTSQESVGAGIGVAGGEGVDVGIGVAVG